MNYFLTLILLFSCNSMFSQQTQEEIQLAKTVSDLNAELDELRINYYDCELHSQRAEQTYMDSLNIFRHSLYLQQKEIETMHKIMRGYIIQIDSLNTILLKNQE